MEKQNKVTVILWRNILYMYRAIRGSHRKMEFQIHIITSSLCCILNTVGYTTPQSKHAAARRPNSKGFVPKWRAVSQTKTVFFSRLAWCCRYLLIVQISTHSHPIITGKRSKICIPRKKQKATRKRERRLFKTPIDSNNWKCNWPHHHQTIWIDLLLLPCIQRANSDI